MAAAVVVLCTSVPPWACHAQTAASATTDLAQRYEAARTQSTLLVSTSHPLYLRSTDEQDTLKGEIFTTVDQPFALVREVTTRTDDWCQILILHLNIKYCRMVTKPTSTLLVGMGRKFDQPLADVYWISFNYRVVQVSDQHLQVELAAAQGPLGTQDYRLSVEAMPAGPTRTLMALSYSQSYGFAARWAFQAYLATLGRGKVGFSVVGQDAQGQPIWVEGLRGVLERNALRYHLALEAWLGQQQLPPSQRVEASLKAWFDATEQFPRQLRELNWTRYVDMKRHEISRQAQWPVPREVQHHWPASP
jgi:hypothetical protein